MSRNGDMNSSDADLSWWAGWWRGPCIHACHQLYRKYRRRDEKNSSTHYGACSTLMVPESPRNLLGTSGIWWSRLQPCAGRLASPSWRPRLRSRVYARSGYRMSQSHSASTQPASCKPYTRVHIPRGDVNHHADQSIEVDRRVRKRLVQRPEVRPQTVRPTERPPRVHDPGFRSQRLPNNIVRLCHVVFTRMPLRPCCTEPTYLLDPVHPIVK